MLFRSQTIIVVISSISSVLLINYLNIGNIYLDLIIRLLISIIIPGILIFVIYQNKESYKDVMNRIKNIFSNIKKSVDKKEFSHE